MIFVISLIVIHKNKTNNSIVSSENSSKNETLITLDKEPNYIFSSNNSNDLFVCIGNELRVYDKEGKYFSHKTNGTLVKASEGGGIIYYINDKQKLYMLDMKTDNTNYILDGISDVSISYDLNGAVSPDGKLYLWGNKAKDFYNSQKDCTQPLLYESNIKWKEIKFSYRYALARDDSGCVYECDLFSEGLKSFHKIESLNNIDSIYGGYGNIAVSKSGTIHYWFGLFNSKDFDPMIDNPWDIEKELNNIKPSRFDFSSAFVVAYNDNDAYFWGENGYSSPNKGIDYIRTPTLDPDLKDFDNLYCGYSIVYLQKGLDIRIVQK